MRVDAELLDDGGADAIEPLGGRGDVGDDGVVADGLVLGDEELLRLEEESYQMSLPLIELTCAVISIA